MGGGSTGAAAPTTSVSIPLSGAQRSEIFQAALKDVGPYLPDRSEYPGYGIVDPSADRGRGDIYRGSGGAKSRGYEGYSNIQPIVSRQQSTPRSSDWEAYLQSYLSKLPSLTNKGADTDRFTYYDEVAKAPGMPEYTAGVGAGWLDSQTGKIYQPITTYDNDTGYKYDSKNLPPEILSMMAQRRS